MKNTTVIFLCGDCHEEMKHTTARYGAGRGLDLTEGEPIWQCTGCGVQFYYNAEHGWTRIPAAVPARSYVAVDE